MKRGEIYFAVLNPTVGSEIQKTRPVLIVSNNIANKYSELVTIVPITSQVKKVYNFEVFIDKESQEFLDGTEVDYVKDKFSGSIKFRNPNVTGECGCGESFTV